jgi:hypothetical protein
MSKEPPVQGSRLTFEDHVLQEAAKEIVLESLPIGREFCKFMVGFASGAVPVYLGLVNLFLPSNFAFASSDRAYLGLPVLGFMLAALLFVWGYMPKSDPFDLNESTSIEAHRRDAIRKRSRLGVAGFGVFMIAVIGAAAVVLFVIPDTAVPAA